METCPTCKREFETEYGVKQHHAKSHGESLAGEKVVCEYCGDESRVTKTQAKDFSRNFCNRDCYSQWRAEIPEHELPEWEPDHDYQDKEILTELYHEKGMSQYDIAEKYGVDVMTINHWMDNHDIKTNETYDWNKTIHPYFGHKRGHEYVGAAVNGETRHAYIHQLLAIADGADPHNIFANDETAIHHKNGVPWDNRPENLQVTTHSEHMKIHKTWEKADA